MGQAILPWASTMNSLLKIAMIASATACGGLTPAHAAVIPFGTITGESGNDSRSWMDTVSGSFTDYATFTTTRTADIAASITNSFSTKAQFIDDLSLSFYMGTIGSGKLVSSIVSTDPNDPPDTQRQTESVAPTGGRLLPSGKRHDRRHAVLRRLSRSRFRACRFRPQLRCSALPFWHLAGLATV